MELYKNKDAFLDAIKETSSKLMINESIIEKDYFVILLLSKLNNEIPGLVFKGGTCCSHAYHAIDRFSEDIDLTLDLDHIGRKNNRNANKIVINVCDEYGFKIINRNEVENHSHGNYNCYLIEYPTNFIGHFVKPYLQIELAFLTKSYPVEKRTVNSIIGDFFSNEFPKDIVQRFELVPFDICVQKLERTFIDKVFAICDYYEKNESLRNSRHIYDLYKISKIIDMNSLNLKELVQLVRNERKNKETCLSAKDEYSIDDTLIKIKKSNFYKSDYDSVTKLLLHENVDYETAIEIIEKIIVSKLFS